MAHGLQPFTPWQDENNVALATRSRMPTPLGDENSFSDAPFGKGSGGGPGQRGGGKGGDGTGQASARRALGNITNQAHRQQGGGGLGKAQLNAGGPRRALGDITNATPSKQQHQLSKQQQGKAEQAALKAKVAVQPSPAEELAERLARDGVERPAGKVWEQLQWEREARQQEDIAGRLARVAASTAGPMPVLGGLGSRKLTCLDEELELEEEKASDEEPELAAGSSEQALTELELTSGIDNTGAGAGAELLPTLPREVAGSEQDSRAVAAGTAASGAAAVAVGGALADGNGAVAADGKDDVDPVGSFLDMGGVLPNLMDLDLGLGPPLEAPQQCCHSPPHSTARPTEQRRLQSGEQPQQQEEDVDQPSPGQRPASQPTAAAAAVGGGGGGCASDCGSSPDRLPLLEDDLVCYAYDSDELASRAGSQSPPQPPVEGEEGEGRQCQPQHQLVLPPSSLQQQLLLQE